MVAEAKKSDGRRAGGRNRMKTDVNKNPIYVIAFATVISGMFTAAIMTLYAATQDTVKANQRKLRDEALAELFSLTDLKTQPGEPLSQLVDRHVAGTEDPDRPDDPRRRRIELTDPVTQTKVRLLVAYDRPLPTDRPPNILDKANIRAYAFAISGVGFWARIDGWIAVDANCEKVLGVVFLEHSETPGLGGRITEPEFRDQFRPYEDEQGRSRYLSLLPPPDPAKQKFIYIDRMGPTGESDFRWHRHVDSISGATGTSSAVGKFLDEDIRRFRRAAIEAGLIASPEAEAPTD